jgi:hypothetical protein
MQIKRWVRALFWSLRRYWPNPGIRRERMLTVIMVSCEYLKSFAIANVPVVD